MPAGRRPVQNPLVCHGHTRPIVELSYSPVTPDGYFLTSASKDKEPMLRNGETGDWIGTFQGHKGAVWSCVLNDTAVLAATGSADYSARLWDALSGDQTHEWEHPGIVRSVHFAHRSPKLVTGGAKKCLRMYDLQQPGAAPQIQDVTDDIRNAQWHQDDNVILCTYLDKPGISVWDVRSQSIVKTLATGKVVTSLEILPGGQYLTTADGHSVKIWDGQKLEVIKEFTSEYIVESASYCPQKKRFASGGEDMWVHLYDYETGQEVDCNKGHHGPVHCVRFAPTGESYASGSEDGTIRIWETDFALKADDSAAPVANGTAAK
ncbi:hypothetical protein WJX72_006420 [[Myrmecia] bisecta]|uniref:Serine-threonine kinase receptor-associated protein n=1 Tax=[Myrmecia] bisecta TaxID=41462 RepID=A0AAW1PK00_9CHLO